MNEQLLKDLIDVMTSKIADAVIIKVQDRLTQIVDDRFTANFGKNVLNEFVGSAAFESAVNEAIDVDHLADEMDIQGKVDLAVGDIDIEDMVRDTVRNMEFTVEVR